MADGRAETVRRGTASCTVAPATDADFDYVNAHLRAMDRFEQDHFLSKGGLDRRDCLSQMEAAWTLRMGGDIVGYVGLQVPPLASPMANFRFMPMLSTTNADRRPVDYARLTRPVLRWVVAHAPPWVTDFFSCPLARYGKSVRWHEKTMGWRRIREFDCGGETAVLFHISRKDIENAAR